jgi:hypothetical protein
VCRPCSTNARATAAVLSGRRVRLRALVVEGVHLLADDVGGLADERTNSSVCSRIGVRISENP